MHAEILNFLEQVRLRWSLLPSPGGRVVEIGSYNINGTARDVFVSVASTYVGVDHRPGPGVDVVSLAHDFTPVRPFDVALCCQVLEHDPYWPATLVHLCWLVRAGGIVAVTCAGPGYVPHELDTSPGFDPDEADHHYRNVSAAEVATMLRAGARYVDLDVVELEAREERNREGGLDVLVWARLRAP